MKQIHWIVQRFGKHYLKLLPASHAAYYCCYWLEGPPHLLNPGVSKHSKHVNPVLKVMGHIQRGPAWSSSSVTAAWTPLWAQSEQSVSDQQSASQSIWAVVARWLLKSLSTPESRQYPLSLSLSFSLSLALAKLHTKYSSSCFIPLGHLHKGRVKLSKDPTYQMYIKSIFRKCLCSFHHRITPQRDVSSVNTPAELS